MGGEGSRIGTDQPIDVFISYSSRDREAAEVLADVLAEQSLSVWWDRSILAGEDFDRVIRAALESARCVVVLWSKTSVASGWVLDEAALGKQRGVLVPVKIDKVGLPLGFGRIHTDSLESWDGDRDDPRFTRLAEAIEAALERGAEPLPADHASGGEPAGLARATAVHVLGQRLRRHRARLGPWYRPLRALLGIVAVALLFAVVLGLPLVVFSDFALIATAQSALVGIYFVRFLFLRQSVFARFCFCALLFVVGAAAPVNLSADSYFHMIVDEGIPEGLAVPKIEFFLYGFLRGVGNLAWALPLLFFFYAFYPTHFRSFKLADRAAPDEAVRRALAVTVWVGLAFQTISAGMLLWRDAVIPRAFASAEGAGPALAHVIGVQQKSYLVFSLLNFALGFAALLAVRRWAAANDRRVLAIVTGGILAVQLAFSLGAYNVRRLNERFPAARTTAATVRAFSDTASGGVVFTNSFFTDISREKLGRFQVYSACENPQSRKFTFRVLPAEEFRERFRETDLTTIRFEARGDLFCQPD